MELVLKNKIKIINSSIQILRKLKKISHKLHLILYSKNHKASKKFKISVASKK